MEYLRNGHLLIFSVQWFKGNSSKNKIFTEVGGIIKRFELTDDHLSILKMSEFEKDVQYQQKPTSTLLGTRSLMGVPLKWHMLKLYVLLPPTDQ